MNEKTLNSFLSTNLNKLGLVHINSEVPKKLLTGTKKPDIIAFDRDTRIPIFLELKVVSNPGVVSQICNYLDKITNTYPNIIEELASFKIPPDFQFNYDYGIVGLVISPVSPTDQKFDTNNSILWAQYEITQNAFYITKRHVLNLIKSKPSVFISRQNYVSDRPSALVKSAWPRLQQFSELMNDVFLSISSSIYPRANMDSGYVAYYTANGTYAIFGIYTGKKKSTFWVTFHIRKPHYNRFLQLPEIRTLESFGVSQGSKQDKGNYFIVPFIVNEQQVTEPTKTHTLIEQFICLAQLSYSLEKDTAIDNLDISNDSINGLCLRQFGLVEHI